MPGGARGVSAPGDGPVGLLEGRLRPELLVSAAISRRGPPRELLDRWERGEFELVVSAEVLFELQEVLARPKFRRYLTEAEAIGHVLRIHDGASEVSEELPGDVVRGVTGDRTTTTSRESLSVAGRSSSCLATGTCWTSGLSGTAWGMSCPRAHPAGCSWRNWRGQYRGEPGCARSSYRLMRSSSVWTRRSSSSPRPCRR